MNDLKQSIYNNAISNFRNFIDEKDYFSIYKICRWNNNIQSRKACKFLIPNAPDWKDPQYKWEDFFNSIPEFIIQKRDIEEKARIEKDKKEEERKARVTKFVNTCVEDMKISHIDGSDFLKIIDYYNINIPGRTKGFIAKCSIGFSTCMLPRGCTQSTADNVFRVIKTLKEKLNLN